MEECRITMKFILRVITLMAMLVYTLITTYSEETFLYKFHRNPDVSLVDVLPRYYIRSVISHTPGKEMMIKNTKSML